MVTCTSIVPARLPAMVTMSCPTCTPASFILSKEVSHSSYFHIFHTFCTLFSELKEGGGQQSMIVGRRRGANCVPRVKCFNGGGESDLHRLEDRRTGISDKKRDRDRGGAADKGGGGVSDVWVGVKRSMGIRLGRDRGGELQDHPPGQNDPLFAYFIFLISRRCRSCQFC